VSDKLLAKQKVLRFLRKYSLDGQLLGEAQLPYSLYASTAKDLVVTTSGEVLQTLPLKDNFEIVKWEVAEAGLRMLSGTERQLAQKLFSYVERQGEDFYPSEGIGDVSERMERSFTAQAVGAQITRSKVIQNAKDYAEHNFAVGNANITTRTGKKDDNVSVQKYVVSAFVNKGTFTGAPYQWGGDDTISLIEDGLAKGKVAGDINIYKIDGKEASRSSLAVGVDCSGFVSRIWEVIGKYSTSSSINGLPTISTRLTSYNDLKPGDILNRSGHVMVFFTRDSSGNYLVYESSATGWKVALNQWTAAYVSSYTPYRYTRIIDELSVVDFWVKVAPLYAGVKNGFDAQFKLKNNTAQIQKVTKVAMAIHDASGKFISDMINVSTVSTKIDITPGSSYQTGKMVVDSPTPAGQYKVVAKISKQDSQGRDIWEELASAPFTVLPSLSVARLWVKNGTPIHAGAKGGFDAQFQLLNISNQRITVPKVAMAIHDANGVFIKDMKLDYSVPIEPGKSYPSSPIPIVVDSPSILGSYKVVVKVSWKTDTQKKDIWEEMATAWFTVTK
jgi:cell wall-associated NlpC family hydrolase